MQGSINAAVCTKEANHVLLSTMSTVPDFIILACSAVGLLVSLYFTLVYYRIMKPDARFVPSFCRLDEATCQYLMGTRNAKILGARNFVLGLLYYAALIIYISVENVQRTIPIGFVIFVSLFTVLLGIYLVYGLIVKLKTDCVLCYTSHAINFIILIALIAKRL
jgi:uncharacterized membrane protein